MVEHIKIGALQLTFLQSKHETGGALDMFECLVPPNSRFRSRIIIATGMRRSMASKA